MKKITILLAMAAMLAFASIQCTRLNTSTPLEVSLPVTEVTLSCTQPLMIPYVALNVNGDLIVTIAHDSDGFTVRNTYDPATGLGQLFLSTDRDTHTESVITLNFTDADNVIQKRLNVKTKYVMKVNPDDPEEAAEHELIPSAN